MLHSNLKSDQDRIAFGPAKVGYRKVILSTNIAESSVTIPDVRYVINFCLTKRCTVDIDTNLEYLSLQWISQAEFKQRTGRAGRVQDGKVGWTCGENV